MILVSASKCALTDYFILATAHLTSTHACKGVTVSYLMCSKWEEIHFPVLIISDALKCL